MKNWKSIINKKPEKKPELSYYITLEKITEKKTELQQLLNQETELKKSINIKEAELDQGSIPIRKRISALMAEEKTLSSRIDSLILEEGKYNQDVKDLQRLKEGMDVITSQHRDAVIALEELKAVAVDISNDVIERRGISDGIDKEISDQRQRLEGLNIDIRKFDSELSVKLKVLDEKERALDNRVALVKNRETAIKVADKQNKARLNK